MTPCILPDAAVTVIPRVDVALASPCSSTRYGRAREGANAAPRGALRGPFRDPAVLVLRRAVLRSQAVLARIRARWEARSCEGRSAAGEDSSTMFVSTFANCLGY